MTGAVIGTGYMGRTHIKILKNIVETLVICSADVETGEILAGECSGRFYRDYREMFEKEQLDFVSVCVPTYMHYSVVKEALEYNVSVLCEKPFTLAEPEAVELYTLAKSRGVLLMVGHCLRFSRAYAYLKECIDSGSLGKPVSIHMTRNSARPGWSPDNWFANAERSGGIIRDLHIHDTDMAVNLFGVPEAVYTTGNEGCCTTVFSYPENVAVTATASWRPAPGFPFSAGFDAVFDNACLVYEKDTLVLYRGEQREDPLAEKVIFADLESDDMMENELRYFCRCLEQGAEPELCHPAETVKTIFVSCAESRSLAKGGFEKVIIPGNIA